MFGRSVQLDDLRHRLTEFDALLALLFALRRGAARDGEVERKLPFGRVLSRAQYRAGKRHGRDTRFWLDGTPRRECEWFEGRRHGRATAWYRNGAKRFVGEFKHGAQTGEWFFFRRNGKLDGPRTGLYENGLRYAAMKGFNDWNA